MWETVVRCDAAVYKTLGCLQDGATVVGESPKFTFKRRLHLKKFFLQDNAKESVLQFHQVSFTDLFY